jgi:hypothetical protein
MGIYIITLDNNEEKMHFILQPISQVDISDLLNLLGLIFQSISHLGL